jgi:modulator of FtsH protease HflK
MSEGNEKLNKYWAAIHKGTGFMARRLGQVRNQMPGRYFWMSASVLVWVFSGFYTIDSSEVGAVQRFNRLNRMTEPGLHYHWPRPIEGVKKCDIETIRRYDIEFEIETTEPHGSDSADGVLVLTGDESLVVVKLVIQTMVSSAEEYLFNLEHPEKTIKNSALTALRSVLGQYRFHSLLPENSLDLEKQIHEYLQKLLNNYLSGIEVVTVKLKRIDPPGPVQDAFADVTQAREQQRLSETEAMQYDNKVVSRARGEATRIVQDAEAQKIQRIKKAQGEAAQFVLHLNAYHRAREVTRKRLYLETMEDIVNRASKVVVASENQVVWPSLLGDGLMRPHESGSPLPQVPK